MRKLMVLASIMVLMGLVAICTSSAATPALHPNGATAVSFASLTARHCSPNQHLCDDCNGGTVCVKNGVMCPVCGPF